MTVTVGVDSYVDEAEFIAYALARGVTLTQDPSVLLINAMDVNEVKNYKGTKTVSTQDLEFPREGVYIDGVLIDSTIVPKDIKDAEMAQGIVIDQGYNPNDTVGRATKKEQLGPMMTEYMDNASNTPYSPRVNALLRPYLDGSNNLMNMKVNHA
jgi:hypothetical protein